MNDENDIITTDNPLTAAQIETLSVLLDVIIPASDDGRMPSLAEFDLIPYILDQAPEFISVLIDGLNRLGDLKFVSRSDRQSRVEEFSKSSAELFSTLLFHSYACYYQDDRVLVGLGLAAGPPFPRGNALESGDLSLLDQVLLRPSMYRT